MVLNDMTCNRRNSKKLESEIFDRRFRFSIHKEICIHDSGIHGCKVAPYDVLAAENGSQGETLYLWRVCEGGIA